MKMAKKVLSVVLAVLMALSCFAVAASAWGNVTADRKVKFTLGATIGSVEWYYDEDEEQSWPITDDPADVETITYGEIEAAPGEIVWVYVSAETNYIAWSVANQIFYSADLIDPQADAWAQVPSYTDSMDEFAEQAIIQWNEDNAFISNCGIDDCIQSPWSALNASAMVDVAKAWPTDDDGKLLPAYANASGTPDTTQWKWQRFSDNVGTGDKKICKISGDDYLLRIPLRVPSTANAGTEYTVKMDEGFIARGTTNKTKFGYINEYNGTTYNKSTCTKPGWTIPATEDEAYWDLSEATLTIKVKGTTPSVDYTELNAAIADFEALTEADYTEDSWATAEAAYEAALDAKTSTDQDEIDAAADDLEKAMTALVEATKLDYKGIDAALNAAAEADTANATATSAAALASAVTAAETAREEATTQKELDDAAAAVNNAIEGLTAKADMTDLEAAIADAALVDTTNWTDDAKTALTNAVIAGQAIVAQADDFADQLAVNNATQAIIDAMAGALKDADYSAVTAAKEAAAQINRELYTAESLAVLDGAIAAVEEGKKIDEQAAVNKMAADINAAIEGLVKKNADYTAVDAAKEAASKINRDIYTAESLELLDAAVLAVEDGKKADEQEAVNQMAADINAAITGLVLKGADYTYVNMYLDQAAAINRDIYTKESLDALDAAVLAVKPGLDITHQDEVTAWANGLYAALEGLVKVGADYTAVNAAKADAAAINRDIYTKESLDALDAAVLAVEEGKTIDEQAAVNKMAADIEEAILALVEADADYSALAAYPTENVKKGTIKSKIDSNSYDFYAYTAESWAAYDAAVKAVPAELKKSQQATVDAAIADVDTAYKALVPSTAAEYIATQEAKLQDSSAYTAESWATYEAAKAEALKYNCVDHNWSTFGKAISGTNGYDAAYKALELKPNAANYTALDKAIADAADVNTLIYTDETVTVFEAALEAANGVNRNLTANDQQIIDDATDALVEAQKGLKLKTADYAGYNNEMTLAAEVDTTLYTEETVAAFEKAYNAAKELALDLDVLDQDIVDTVTNALTEAREKLALKPANYTVLDGYIKDAEAVETEKYTEESVAVLAKILADAKEVARDLTIEDQANIDNVANALIGAINGLKLKPTEPEEPAKGIAKEIDFDAAAADGWNNDYEIKLEGRPMMVQFYETTTGNTNSYDRYNNKVTIVSYDKDGNVVDSDNIRQIAYEVWTIEGATVGYDTIKVRAKANGSPVWESKDADLLTFVNEAPKLDAELKGDLVADKSGKPGNFAISGTVGKDAIRVQVKMADGSTNTATLTKNDDGTQSFTVNGWAVLGENTVTVRVKASDGTWSDLGTVDYTAAK